MGMGNIQRCIRQCFPVPNIVVRRALRMKQCRMLSQTSNINTNAEPELDLRATDILAHSFSDVIKALRAVLQTQEKYQLHNVPYIPSESQQIKNSRYGWPGKPLSDIVWFENELGSELLPNAQDRYEKAAMANFDLISKDPSIFRIHADCRTNGGYMATAAFVPSTRVCRTQVLGAAERSVAFKHPTWQGSPFYVWSMKAAGLYSLLQAAELASARAPPSQRVVIFYDHLDLTYHRLWQLSILYSQLKQLYTQFSNLHSVFMKRNISVMFHYVPKDLPEQIAASDACREAACPRKFIAAGGHRRFPDISKIYEAEYQDKRLPMPLRNASEELFHATVALRDVSSELPPEEMKRLTTRKDTARDARMREIRNLDPDTRTYGNLSNLTLQQTEWVKADYIWRTTHQASALQAFNQMFPRERLPPPPPDDLTPPYPQPYRDTLVAWNPRTGKVNWEKCVVLKPRHYGRQSLATSPVETGSDHMHSSTSLLTSLGPFSDAGDKPQDVLPATRNNSSMSTVELSTTKMSPTTSTKSSRLTRAKPFHVRKFLAPDDPNRPIKIKKHDARDPLGDNMGTTTAARRGTGRQSVLRKYTARPKTLRWVGGSFPIDTPTTAPKRE